MITTVAPAKINWTLEVLGGREDGYHDVRSVLQTIELHDEVSVEEAEALTLDTGEGHAAADDDLVLRAARLLQERNGRGEGASIRLVKRIPVAAGMGGGSSDAAATLRALDRLWALHLSDEALRDLAAELGSDVPFFVHGGAALAEGRGDQVTTLADTPPVWLVLVVPPIHVPDKTRSMYEALQAEDLTDGSRTQRLAEHLRQGKPAEDALFCNAFERAAYEMFEGLHKYREWMLTAGARSVRLCGAGPALFALASGQEEALAIRARMNRPKMGERVYAVWTLGAAEAAAMW